MVYMDGSMGVKSSMSILVNGSPTKDFRVCKGLRQGDPLLPFLFVIATEGLNRLMKNATRLDLFRGLMVNERVSYNLL